MVSKFSKEDVKDARSNFGTFFDWIVTIVDDFWFNNRNKSCSLTDGGIFGEDLAIFFDGYVGRSEEFSGFGESDFESSAPFSKA